MERRGPRSPVEGALEYINAKNYDFKPGDGRIEELVVWGGIVANCAEGALSKAVDRNCGVLRRATYVPDRTKGGVLIRPKYYRGDRDGKVVFPLLTDLTIRLEPVLLPSHYGWITPNLERLRLVCVLERRDLSGNIEALVPCVRSLRSWLGTEPNSFGADERSYPQLLLDSCPRLESITIALCSTLDEGRTERDWIVAVPPRPIPWNIHRLLLLPLLKPCAEKPKVPDTEVVEFATFNGSHLSALSLPLVNVVLSFLGSFCWKYSEREVDLPAALSTSKLADLLQPPPPKKDEVEMSEEGDDQIEGKQTA